MSKQTVVALDQGTTSSRAMAFNREGQAIQVAQQEFPQILPEPGHVEHDPEALWTSQLQTARDVVERIGVENVAALGITNQRETTLVWERESGKPIDNAIVWQSRITADECRRLRDDGHESLFRERTGLLLDPYFSGTKVKYLLDRHDSNRERSRRGDLLFGTVDSYLIWRLTGGRIHVTDPSNASRTLLFNIYEQCWDDELLKQLNVPREMLPEVRPSSCVYGETDPEWFGAAIPIASAAGDQQAATFGQGCFEPGSAKNTFGTGSFLLLNTGTTPVASKNKLLTTIGWSLNGETTYCLEGSVFISGAVVQWLRDGLGVIASSGDVEQLAGGVEDHGGVYVVPAFVGLGAPHWDPYARGAIFGLTRGSTAGHIARAALDSMAFQTLDLLSAMQADYDGACRELKVDGGAAVNDGLLQFQADVLDTVVRRPQVLETTALGAAYLAGLAVGVWSGLEDVSRNWRLDQEFRPQWEPERRSKRVRQWRKAVQRSLDWEEQPE